MSHDHFVIFNIRLSKFRQYHHFRAVCLFKTPFILISTNTVLAAISMMGRAKSKTHKIPYPPAVFQKMVIISVRVNPVSTANNTSVVMSAEPHPFFKFCHPGATAQRYSIRCLLIRVSVCCYHQPNVNLDDTLFPPPAPGLPLSALPESPAICARTCDSSASLSDDEYYRSRTQGIYSCALFHSSPGFAETI